MRDFVSLPVYIVDLAHFFNVLLWYSVVERVHIYYYIRTRLEFVTPHLGFIFWSFKRFFFYRSLFWLAVVFVFVLFGTFGILNVSLENFHTTLGRIVLWYNNVCYFCFNQLAGICHRFVGTILHQSFLYCSGSNARSMQISWRLEKVYILRSWYINITF